MQLWELVKQSTKISNLEEKPDAIGETSDLCDRVSCPCTWPRPSLEKLRGASTGTRGTAVQVLASCQ